MAAPTPDVMAIASLLKSERFYRDAAQWDLCRATFPSDAALTYINVAWSIFTSFRERSWRDLP